MNILVLSGANLNKLGSREHIYGDFTMEQLQSRLTEFATMHGAKLEFFTSNREGELIEAVQNCSADGLICNFGGFSHTSVAISDALRMLVIPKIEVHITNIHARESFRQNSLTAGATDGVICGLGVRGYELAILYLIGEKL